MEIDILYIKTFAIVATMLLITAQTASINRAFEKPWEFWGTFLGALVLIFIIPLFYGSLLIALLLTGLLAGLMGWMIGPGIASLMQNFMIRRSLKKKGLDKKALKTKTKEEIIQLYKEAQEEIKLNQGLKSSLEEEWKAVFNMAMYGTAITTISTGLIVFMTNIDFGFLGLILFVALLALIVLGLLNAFYFKSPFVSLISAYIGVVIFTLYLLYDFNQLEKFVEAGDTSWATAINMGISIYLDIINLFLDLLEILASD